MVVEVFQANGSEGKRDRCRQTVAVVLPVTNSPRAPEPGVDGSRDAARLRREG
jgi:hypothetical protein